jgi:hypothetical protein
MNSIILSDKLRNECIEWGESFSKYGKSQKNFGDSSFVRSKDRLVRDAVLGRVGELGLGEIGKEYDVELKFNTALRYGKREGDNGQDINGIVVDGVKRHLIPKIDVKTSQFNSGWLLVERYRLEASIYVFMRADANELKKVEFVGYAFYNDFFAKDKPIFRYLRGDKLLHPIYLNREIGVPLSCADQVGLPAPMLRKENFWGLLTKLSIIDKSTNF